tara:strand:- start:31 stop:288 length:258 start_codon:yes stop_codon:yes gene_type:complete
MKITKARLRQIIREELDGENSEFLRQARRYIDYHMNKFPSILGNLQVDRDLLEQRLAELFHSKYMEGPSAGPTTEKLLQMIEEMI